MNQEKNTLTTLFYVLYMLVHFLPPFWGADGMGIQWLYISVLDFLVLGYLLLNRTKYKAAFIGIFNNKFLVVYLLYLIWALGSYFYAINRTEAMVCLARLATTFILFTNLSVLLYKKDIQALLKKFSFIISLVVIFDCIVMTVVFFMFFRKIPYTNVVLNLCGMSYGNKNITAASMLINVPFVIYYIHQSKLKGKVLGILSLSLAIFSLFILSTRSTFVGLLLILSIYIFYTLLIQEKRSLKSIMVKLAYFILPIVFVYFIANIFINYASNTTKDATMYGTVTKRVADISIEKGGDRLAFWKTGIDYAKHHLLFGDGYGNWKIASLPYEKDRIVEFIVPYHAHNDFIENFADLGVIGGLLYMLLYLFAFYFILKIWFSKKYKQFAFTTTIAFMAFTCYFVDAALNFPAERPVMQVMFAFTAAFFFSPLSLLKNKHDEVDENKLYSKTQRLFSKIFITVMSILLLAAIFINTQVYRSMLYQRYMMGDLGVKPNMKMKDVKNVPLIPNLSYNTLPMNAMLARYYIRDSNYKEAYRLLNADKNANPVIYYNDYVLSQYFSAVKNSDSAYYYAKIAFHNWPRAGIYYYNLMPLAIDHKDSAEMNFAFNRFITYRNDLSTWKQYIEGRNKIPELFDLKSNNKILDSALKLFPKDSATLLKLNVH